MKYVANPIEVEAHRIIGVAKKANADCSVNVALENGENQLATSGMLARYTPVPGDYWVIQSDGYVYLNPKEVFERKYHTVD